MSVCVHVYECASIEPICFHLRHTPSLWEVNHLLHVILLSPQYRSSQRATEKILHKSLWLSIPRYPSPGQELGFPKGHFLRAVTPSSLLAAGQHRTYFVPWLPETYILGTLWGCLVPELPPHRLSSQLGHLLLL